MNSELLGKVGKFVPEEILEVLLDEWNSVVIVDRTVQPAYPDFVKKVKYPELELVGPADFNASNLEQWLHLKQEKGGITTGHEIYEELIAKKMLEICLNIVDLGAIQNRGISFFRRHFAGKMVLGWKSVILNRDSLLGVPYLYEGCDDVEMDWISLDLDLHSGIPVLHLAV